MNCCRAVTDGQDARFGKRIEGYQVGLRHRPVQHQHLDLLVAEQFPDLGNTRAGNRPTHFDFLRPIVVERVDGAVIVDELSDDRLAMLHDAHLPSQRAKKYTRHRHHCKETLQAQSRPALRSGLVDRLSHLTLPKHQFSNASIARDSCWAPTSSPRTMGSSPAAG